MTKRLKLLFYLCIVTFVTNVASCYAQYETDLTVSLNEYTKELDIRQEFTYYNNSNYNLGVIYFNDWANAYSDKNTGLAKRFAQEFKKSLHLAKADERGKTTIISVVDDAYNGLEWSRTEGKDMLKVTLDDVLAPKTSTKIFITYKVKLPPNKYTRYGYGSRGDYYLKDWYLTPAVYDGKWHLYSNKNLEDLYMNETNTTINFKYPDSLYLASNFDVKTESTFPNGQFAQLKGNLQRGGEIILNTQKNFHTHRTPYMTFMTDISAPRYSPIGQG
ncbi:MAG: metalloprotease, partial [Maribacter sp.]